MKGIAIKGVWICLTRSSVDAFAMNVLIIIRIRALFARWCR
jgi:hypothetical protein